jgi:uncharacterized membrane protein
MEAFLILMAMFVNAIGWSIKPIIEKKYVIKSNFVYFSFLRYFVAGCIVAIPLFLYYSFQYAPKSYSSPRFVKEQVYGAALAGICGIIAALSNYYLLSKFKVSYVIPALEGLVILVTVILSKMILNESVSPMGSVGIIAIVIGILLLGYESMGSKMVNLTWFQT